MSSCDLKELCAPEIGEICVSCQSSTTQPPMQASDISSISLGVTVAVLLLAITVSTVVILGIALKVRSYRKRVTLTEGPGDAIAGLYDTIDNVGVAPPLPLRKGIEMFSNEAYMSHTEKHLVSEGGAGANKQEEDYESIDHRDLADCGNENVDMIQNEAYTKACLATARDNDNSIVLSENEAYLLTNLAVRQEDSLSMARDQALEASTHHIETVDMVENEAYSLPPPTPNN